MCISTAQGAHSGSAGKGGSEVLPDNARGAHPKSIYKCIMGIVQSLILKSVCLGISWRVRFERRLSTEKMREIFRIKLFPSSCGTAVRFQLESETEVWEKRGEGPLASSEGHRAGHSKNISPLPDGKVMPYSGPCQD